MTDKAQILGTIKVLCAQCGALGLKIQQIDANVKAAQDQASQFRRIIADNEKKLAEMEGLLLQSEPEPSKTKDK